MEAYLLDWANLLVRWLHVIVAIAWIGSSFYFVWLDCNLVTPAQKLRDQGVDGDNWSVHGGGFYHALKYMVAPQGGAIDSKLHWFYWESYWTFISGFALFCIYYLWNASSFLVDKSVFDWSGVAAGFGAIGFLVGFWIIYDLICRVFGDRKGGDNIVALLVLIVVAAACWLATHLFAGRAAFLIVGAMIATTMTLNVFFIIIPGQRKVVATMTSGQPYDADALAIHGRHGKQRSVHNTYFTLPVIIAMISNHYGFLYAHAQSWLVLFAIMLAGALVRQYFVARHAFHLGRGKNPWLFAVLGIAIVAALVAWMRPAPLDAAAAASVPDTVGYAQLAPVLEQRCESCHGAAVQQKGLRFDSEAEVMKHARDIHQQVVVTRQMPFSNATQMTDAERLLVDRWYQGLADN